MGDVQSKNTINAGGDVKFTNKNNVHISIAIGVIVVVLAVIGIAFLAFPQNTNEKLIIGRWQLDGSEKLYEFTDDGQFLYLSGSSDGATITYSINDDTLQLDMSLLWANATIIADIEVTKDHLTLSNFIDPEEIWGMGSNDVLEFTRVE